MDGMIKMADILKTKRTECNTGLYPTKNITNQYLKQRKMITEKSKISKNFPLVIKFCLRRKLSTMYIFPQGYTGSGTINKLSYDDEKSRKGETVYKTKTYWLYEEYYFRWLFICLIFTVRLKPESTSYVIHKDYRPDMDVQKLKHIKESQSN